jgi:hypothetical protein
MKARLLFHRRIVMSEAAFAELVLWALPSPARGSRHGYKYRLAFVVNGECVLRYDNDVGKGDHIHDEGGERPYAFVDPDRLVADFLADVRRWLDEDRDT